MKYILVWLLAVWQAVFIQAINNGQKTDLHSVMTLEEMKHYLETHSQHDIPEYDVITLPFPRTKRSATKNFKTYSVSAFGKNFLLDLTPARDTISADGIIVQRRVKEGLKEETYHPDGELYHGQVRDDFNSKVAVRLSREGKELSGAIFVRDHMYKIEPIKRKLKEKAGLHGNGHHVVSKRKIRPQILEKIQASDVPSDVQHRGKRSYEVIEITEPRIIEFMITIDKPTYDFYGNGTMDYVVSVANMVNRLYKDPSMGLDVSVLLTKVFIIQHDEPFLDIKTHQIKSAVGYLRRFRRWATKQASRTPPASPGHFDNGALLTKKICGLNYCSLDGVAYAGYPCNPNLGFSINDAQGLQAAFSLAHEMGHNLGLSHDSGDCYKGFIMSGGQQAGPNSFRWSRCSSNQMKQIMSKYTCYNDKPARSIAMPTRLPGYIYDADKQCKMAYDSSYSVCPVTKGSCKQLFCRKGSSCVGKGSAPLDGTPCGQRKWCLRGHCVDIGNDLPPPVNGQWGSWSHYTKCTKPCGGGVRYKKRYCNNPKPQYGGKGCEGPSEAHEEICNTKECSYVSTVNLRTVECKKHGVNNSYYRSDNPCTLYCRRGNRYSAYGHVLDGTRCTSDKHNKDTCVRGQCRKVGCDGVLGSGNEYDRCRKCSGNGGSCTLVKLPDYTKDYRVYGLKKPDVMFTIPTGATNVRIKELGKTNNFMSLKLSPSSSSSYIIPVPRYTNTYEAAGTVIEHIMKGITDDETITVRGPTTQPLYAVFVYVGFYKNPGFSCQYYLPGNGKPTKYVWKVTKGTTCDADCAGGERINYVTCHRVDDDTAVGTQNCDQATKPATRESCNTQPCKPEWKIGDWMMCSKSCAGGQQTRSVTCQQKISKTSIAILKDTSCDVKSKPQSMQKCNERDCPPEWNKNPWTKCSVECGGGSRSRTISCRKTLLNQTTIRLKEDSCMTEIGYKPPLIEKCNTMACYVWIKEYPCEGCYGYRHLGCYVDKEKRALSKLISSSLPSDAIKACYKEAKAQGYKIFAVQNGNECWTSSSGLKTYSKYGASDVCKNGKGGNWANDVYAIAQEKHFRPIGCFKDKHRPIRPLPKLLANLRDKIDWKNISKTVIKCGDDAWEDGFPVFGLQFYGECWSGPLGHKSYMIDGNSLQGCWNGVGGSGSNYVYAFTRKVIKTMMSCRHVITNAKVTEDHCKAPKHDDDLRLCSEVCNL